MKDIKRNLIQSLGFVADPSKSLKSNTWNQILAKPKSFFTNRMLNMSFHNLCDIEKNPSNATLLLGLGSKFCLQSRIPRTDLIKTFLTISRSIQIECFMEYISKETPHGIGNPNELSFNPKLYIKSKFKPPLAAFFVKDELHKFRDMIAELHEMLPQVPCFNIDKLQHLILSSLRNNSNIVLLNADKTHLHGRHLEILLRL